MNFTLQNQLVIMKQPEVVIIQLLSREQQITNLSAELD